MGSNFNITFRWKPQVGGIKIVTVQNWSIFQVECLIQAFSSFFEGGGGGGFARPVTSSSRASGLKSPWELWI